MQLFISQYQLKIDKKGRVSVPAPFRAVLAAEQTCQGPHLIAYASFTNPCIEACGPGRIEQLSAAIDQLDPFAPERDAFATAILGGATSLTIDGDGRIILPESLLSCADLREEAVFIGKGKTFEIWQPTKFAAYAAEARNMALNKRASLSLVRPSNTGE